MENGSWKLFRPGDGMKEAQAEYPLTTAGSLLGRRRRQRII
jgi:hypothetical protein